MKTNFKVKLEAFYFCVLVTLIIFGDAVATWVSG